MFPFTLCPSPFTLHPKSIGAAAVSVGVLSSSEPSADRRKKNGLSVGGRLRERAMEVRGGNRRRGWKKGVSHVQTNTLQSLIGLGLERSNWEISYFSEQIFSRKKMYSGLLSKETKKRRVRLKHAFRGNSAESSIHRENEVFVSG